jgi:hypothetical protein
LQDAKYSDSSERRRIASDKITTFWTNKRTAKEMDAVYDRLLKKGSSSVARHHELTGKLSAIEAAHDPVYANEAALLTQLPPITTQTDPREIDAKESTVK